jgi:hypothetical protein
MMLLVRQAVYCAVSTPPAKVTGLPVSLPSLYLVHTRRARFWTLEIDLPDTDLGDHERLFYPMFAELM